ncbi:LPXTG cell wall anchor domain-containing protein [Enterococcus faecium]|uniref:LPXTG cell wall anchor domain-containing protein n=1 Tax=Enterococcus faecium TaxID=1352 RepID=UPI0023B287BF|nr:LPXTG cell wall anchor domain-containing protein [Enterococcus faecium]
MKKIKKLLTSTLSLGLVLGNMGGTVVEAASALHSIELPALRQLRPQEDKKAEEKQDARASTLPQLPIVENNLELETTNIFSNFSTPPPPIYDIEKEVYAAVIRRMEYIISEAMKNHDHTFQVGERITVTDQLVGWAFAEGPVVGPAVPITAIPSGRISFFYNLISGFVYTTNRSTASGNWTLTFRGNTGLDRPLVIELTRNANNPITGNEVFPNYRTAYGHDFADGSRRMYEYELVLNMPSATESMGELGVEAKDGPHYLWIENDLPDPTSYLEIDQSNVKWDLKTEWEIPPRMDTIGTQNTRIKVTEDISGRTKTIDVPITVQTRDLQINGKTGPHSIYLNEAIPSPSDFFEVRDPLEQSYSLVWIDTDMTSVGTKTWRAKATTADGREAIGSITMEVLPVASLDLKLRTVENRQLAGSYETLASSFKEYIQEARMEGQTIDVDNLELVESESVEPDYSIAGEQQLKLTVQTEHPVTGQMIKGTAETKVNVRWGDTFLLKAHDGRSAGAYAFQLRNGNNARIVATRGLDSPLDERIGLEDSLYYSIEVLRNNQQIYFHEVPGRGTLQQVIDTFGDGNRYLDVRLGDIINIHHPQRSAGSSVLMVEEKEQDFTYGTDNAYYRVTAFGFEPLPVLPDPAIQLKLKPMEDRSLGETSSSLASTFKNYIKEATFEGEPVAIDDLEFVAAESTEPTNTIASKQDIRITVQAKHPISGETIKGTAETSVNYLWGDTFMIKSSEGGSAGAYSLHLRSGNAARLTVTSGLPSALDERVGTEESMHALYYSLEVLRNNQSIYNYEVLGRGTLRQVINNFGNGNGYYDVRLDDVIKIYHPQRSPNSSVVMIDEEERDFTYDSEYAYYRVSAFGLEPIPVMEAEGTAQTFSLMDDVSTLDVKELVKDVTINHQSISEDRYTIEQLSEIDTSTTGKRTTKVKIMMNDGLAETEIEVPYEVQWGSTFVLRGLEEMTVGAFSLLKEDDRLAIHASPGSNDTDLNRPVNNPFGRGIYYAIEVLENDTRKYNYEVTGNTLIRQSVNGFNNGQPLAVNVGDTIKVYHAETQGRNLLMMDEMVRDYTGGFNYAYYRVTEEGFEPFTDIKADPISQELLLGHETNTVNPAELIQNVTFNGRPLTSDLYTVEQLSNFDTTTVGEKGVRVRVSTTDGTGFTEVKIPYVVKWGSTIRVKNNDGATIGAFSLIKQTNPNTQNTQIIIRASQGVANTELSKVVHDYSDRSIYYQFDVMNKDNTTSRFTYDVTGNRTIEQALSRFNSGQPLNVNIGDIVRIYHTKEFRRNMLMEDEQEKNFTYGSQYAYYEVTEYGFEPSGKIDVEANKVEIPRGATDLDLKSFIKNVKVNDKVIPENLYTVSLNSEIDTSTPGRNNVAVNVTTDSSYGGFSTELNMPYEVRDHTTNSSTNESQNNHTNNEDTSSSTERNEGTTPSIQDDPTTSADNESSLNMPQTNATRNTVWTLIGIALVTGIGAIVMRRKTKEKAENQ